MTTHENKNQRRLRKIASAARYSRTEARYTGAAELIRSAYLPVLRYRATRPTGNWRPALLLREMPFLVVLDPWALSWLAIAELRIYEGGEKVSMTKRETKRVIWSMFKQLLDLYSKLCWNLANEIEWHGSTMCAVGLDCNERLRWVFEWTGWHK